MEQMRKISNICGFLLLVVASVSCSDDFLNQNKKNWQMLADTLYLNNHQDNVAASVQLPGVTNSGFMVIVQPKWLSFKSMHGKVSGGNAPLDISIVKSDIVSGYQTHYAQVTIDVENAGLFSFTVAYTNSGNPSLLSSVSSLNFESLSSRTFTISNTSDGILNWEITAIPDWLIISPASGTLSKGNSTTVTASLNLVDIPTGQDLSGTLVINNNSVTGNLNIPVLIPENILIPSTVMEINGIITDAEFNHETGMMVICTKSPNSLIVFNTTLNVSNTIPLDKTPSCVSLSEDGHKAVIGYTVSSLSYFDIDNLNFSGNFSIDCIPFDVVLGDNGWCYITPSVDQWVQFRSLNLISGELVVGNNQSTVYEKTLIRKIPGKPYLIGSRTTLSPTGILIFDVTKGIASDTITYYHTSIGKFCISEDGAKLYDSYRNVYNMPVYDYQYHPFSPPVFGQIQSVLNYISAFEECPSLSSIFVASSYYDYMSGYSSLIEQFNTVNLNKVKTYNVSPVFVTENGVRTLYETSAKFIFVNKKGTTLYALKNLKENYSKDFWTIETFLLN
jgi:hypothetical protein